MEFIPSKLSLNKEWNNNYELIKREYGKITPNNRIWVDYTVARFCWVAIANTVTKKIPSLGA